MLAIGVLSCMLAGCSGSGGATAGPTVTVTATKTVIQQTTVSTGGTTATAGVPVATARLAIGKSITLPDVRSAVVAFQATALGQPQQGKRLAGLKVKVCAIKKTRVSDAPWSLIGSDSGNY